MLSDQLPELPAWTIFLAALLAPLGVWILWRLQVIGVEVLRARLLKLLKHATWLYNVVSWFGTFLHEVSHASVLLLSGHGIKQFRVRTDSGHVLPRRVRRGPVGFLFFLVAALAPLFGPPLLALGGLLLVDRDLMPFGTAGLGLAEALVMMESLVITFPVDLVRALGNLDMTQGWHAAALAIILMGIPGSRPSHVKGSRFHGDDDEGDVAVVRARIRKNPWPLLGFLVLILAAYYPLVKWVPAVYWYPFQAVWAVALTAIVLALVGALVWTLVAWNVAAKWYVVWMPLAAMVAVQVLPRVQEWDWPLPLINAVSLVAYAALAATLWLVAPRHKWARL